VLDGQAIQVDNSAQAQVHGIAAIYQEPMIFPDLNVAENIFIGHQQQQGTVVNWRRMYREAERILSSLGVHLDVRSQARGLTLAAQQTGGDCQSAVAENTRVDHGRTDGLAVGSRGDAAL
jgi:rhamnose transport system ATP-binding protein